MANADEKLVDALVERVHEGENRFNGAGLGIKVQLSLGGATAYASAELEGIFHQADERMYAEKTLHRKGG